MQEEVLFKITNGLYVISAPHKEQSGTYAGALVDAITQIAINPNLLILSCMNAGYTKECIEHFGRFGISILSQDTPPEILANFGFQTSRLVNKWQNTDYTLANGLPYLKQCLGKIEAKVIEIKRYSCNTLFVAEIEDAFDADTGHPLTYADYRNSLKTQVIAAWKQSQTQLKEKTMETSDIETKHWVCTVCGYVYDGEVPFEDLPEDWLCPLCGVGKEFFELR